MLKSLTKKILSCTFFKLNYIAKPLFQKNNFKLSKFKMFNLYSFGKKNPKKIFYVIKRTPGAGLFSNVIYVLNHILIARKHGFIPFVDFQNFNTIYNEKKKIVSYNSWEYYFNQLSNYKIKDIYNDLKSIDNKHYYYDIGFNDHTFIIAKYNNNFRIIQSWMLKYQLENVIFNNDIHYSFPRFITLLFIYQYYMCITIRL